MPKFGGAVMLASAAAETMGISAGAADDAEHGHLTADNADHAEDRICGCREINFASGKRGTRSFLRVFSVIRG